MRFEKFNNNWSRTTISKVCVCNPKNEDKLDDEFIYIDLESVEKGVLKSKNIIHLKNAPSRAQRILYKNDILFQSVRPYQRNNYLLNEDDDFLQYVASTGYIQLRTTLNPYFLFQLLNTDKINNEVMLRCTGTSYPAINSNDFSNILITITNDRNEQNKIAKFFSLIEERIQTQIKIINDYKILKNHIIKSFIKQNGTSYLLSEIAELGRGRVINSAEISKQKNPIYPVYSSQTSNNGIMGYLDNYDYEGEYITWTTDGANAGTVYYRNGKFNCTNVCGILKIKNGYDAYYISNILNCYTKKYVSTNLANPKLMNNVMANIKINLPSIEQQKHSSKILQSIEYRVEIEEDIKLNLVKQKAFLLKNMFI
ncbi:restriction endonuclease subunit S [Holdemanella biformis]|uniref:restriction endonuclease subunit S n=1 Tax=Holdemanella biformis TaxID=1735 RepID=UPI0022E79DB0|nr:restriction endonuclease subunit S [Holdemanella biformis]